MSITERPVNYFPAPDQCSGEPLIQMEQVVKTFRNAAGEFTALKGITACFYPGEFVSVVGKSGSGKSTLANMITGIDHPTSGVVRINQINVHQLSENDMSLWRGVNLGIVFQFFQLLPTLTLLENVILPMYLARLHTPGIREQRARDLLRAVGLQGFEDKLPAAVSGGQQQSAAIARALSADPPILIADEPTGNLDSRTADEVFDLFAGLIDEGKTILMVTHDIGLAQRTTRTLLLSDGELIEPWVASALPALGHSRMLWLTHHMEARSFLPGSSLPLSPEVDWLLLVTGGCLEVSFNGSRPAAVLGPGSCLLASRLDLGQPTACQLKASPQELVEILLVDGAVFSSWLEGTLPVHAALQGQIQKRQAGWSWLADTEPVP